MSLPITHAINGLVGNGTIGDPVRIQDWTPTSITGRVYRQIFASSNSFLVSHNLGEQFVSVSVWRTDLSPPRMIPDNQVTADATSANSTTVSISGPNRPVVIVIVG